MASTTFSGPIKAGTIANTTGTTLGDDVKNTGQVVMCQSVAVDQTATSTETEAATQSKNKNNDNNLTLRTSRGSLTVKKFLKKTCK